MNQLDFGEHLKRDFCPIRFGREFLTRVGACIMHHYRKPMCGFFLCSDHLADALGQLATFKAIVHAQFEVTARFPVAFRRVRFILTASGGHPCKQPGSFVILQSRDKGNYVVSGQDPCHDFESIKCRD
jgi:hypothetical protein